LLERTYIPLGSGRLQREILVVPPNKEPIPTGTLPQRYEQEVNSQVSVSGLLDPINPSAGQKIKRVIAELEKRRAELFTMALEATARAQEAEQKRAEAEAIARHQPALLEYEVRGSGLGTKLKFAFYGLAVALLLLGAGWLLMENYL